MRREPATRERVEVDDAFTGMTQQVPQGEGSGENTQGV
jgi:hypothetical protein